MKSKVHVKSGDKVELISGRDAAEVKGTGKARPRGKVLAVSPKEGKVIVEGRNMVKKHVKPRSAGQQGGIVEAEAAMYASKVMLVCPKCDKATRVGHAFDKNGKKMRACKKCGAQFE